MIVPMYVGLCEAEGCDTQTHAYPSRADLRTRMHEVGWTWSASKGHRCPYQHPRTGPVTEAVR